MTVSSHPQRRRRRKWTGANPSGVGLDDADNAVDILRADTAATAGVARGGIGRGDKGVGSVIDIQMGALGAFEQDLFAGFTGLLKRHRHVGNIRFQSFGELSVLALDRFEIHGVGVQKVFQIKILFRNDGF